MSDFLNHIRYRQAQARRLDALLAMPKEEAEAFFSRMDVIFARCNEVKWASGHNIIVRSHDELSAMEAQTCSCGKLFVNTDFVVCPDCRTEEQAVAYRAVRREQFYAEKGLDLDF